MLVGEMWKLCLKFFYGFDFFDGERELFSLNRNGLYGSMFE